MEVAKGCPIFMQFECIRVFNFCCCSQSSLLIEITNFYIGGQVTRLTFLIQSYNTYARLGIDGLSSDLSFWYFTRNNVISVNLCIVCFPYLVMGILLHHCYFADTDVAAVQPAADRKFQYVSFILQSRRDVKTGQIKFKKNCW